MRRFFGSTNKPQLLEEESSSALGGEPLRMVCIDKSKGDIGITLANSDDGVGVTVVALKEDGLAMQAGMQVGAIIRRINAHDVDTHAAAIQLIDAAKCVELELSADSYVEESIPPTVARSSSAELFVS